MPPQFAAIFSFWKYFLVKIEIKGMKYCYKLQKQKTEKKTPEIVGSLVGWNVGGMAAHTYGWLSD